MLSLRTGLIVLSAIAIGSVSTVLAHIAARKLAALRGDLMALLMTGLVSIAIYTVGMLGLAYLAAPARSLAPVFALAWMAGIGLMRWWLRD